jgi:hypothetical protein
VAQIRELRSAYSAAKLRYSEATQAFSAVANGRKGIPNAPFKSTWPALVMKRMIRWAVDNGYHSVAWTTGEQQNERYGLGQTIHEVVARPTEDGRLMVAPDSSLAEGFPFGEPVFELSRDSLPGARLVDRDEAEQVFGAALTERMFSRDGEERQSFGGTPVWRFDIPDGLQIGGDGMRAFYDRNLVNITNDLIKKYGAKVTSATVMDEQDVADAAARQKVIDEAQAVVDNPDATVEDVADARTRIEFQREQLNQTGQQQWSFPVTDKMADAAKSGFSLFQGGDNQPRGRIDFDKDNRAIIRLFEGHDLSTLIHESGHLWLEELKADANRPDAPQQVKDDWDQVRAWFRANGHRVARDGTVPTEAHELWARGFERYAMEGKAPSSALQSAFASFRSWLLRLYRVVANLNTPLTDDVRGVMDRMLATQSAIDEVAGDAENALLFKNAAEAGMTDAEFAAYREAAQETRTEAFDALLYRTMETIRRERTAAWKRERQGVRAEVDASVRSRPEFRALALLRGTGGERVQLNRQAIVDQYGSDILAQLPRGVPPTVVDEGGVHPQILAEMAGFRTADEMINMLVGVETHQRQLKADGDKRSVLQEEVDQLTDQAMRERHGDVLQDGSIEEEALAAIHNDRRAEVISSEVRALARRSTRAGDQVPTPWRVAKAWAERTVREGTVADQASASALARHRRNELKAARAADKAMLEGNVDEAYRQKQSQMFHHALFRSAKEAKEQVDAIVKRLGKFAKASRLPSMDPDYLDRIHELLEAYDFKPRTARDRAERASFIQWAAQREEAGEEVYIPPRLADIGTTNFAALQVQDLIGLDDAVASVAHLGRRKQKLLAAREEADLNDLVAEAKATAEQLPNRKTTTDRNEPKNLRRRLRATDALLVKMEFLADQLDGADNPNGAFNRVLIRGATDAANT